MQVFHSTVLRIGKVMDVIGGTILSFMMLITVTDVVLRFVAKPITGTYELVFLGGAVVIGCAIPVTSWGGGHVSVDFALEYFPSVVQLLLKLFTRILGVAFFVLMGIILWPLGTELYTSGEVSLTLHVPYYPVAYTLSVCAFVEVLVLVSDFIKNLSGGKS